MMRRALVTGGAGYIGAHMVRLLLDGGWDVAVIDNLCTGHRSAVDRRARFHRIDLCDHSATAVALAEENPDLVLHFAALSLVGESMAQPERYLRHNIDSTASLLAAMRAADCRALVHSSSCSVYGVAQTIPMDESHPIAPLSPYGESKAQCEMLIAEASSAWGLAAVALRYFNVAGCLDRSLAERHVPETHLIPNLLKAAVAGAPFDLYGTDHPTPDGTAIRDYIHVVDLAEAHRIAGEKLLAGSSSGFRALNLGSGSGYSVRQVLAAVEAATGRSLHVRTHAPRPGDPPELRADTRRWQAWCGQPAAQHDLTAMIASAWQAMQP